MSLSHWRRPQNLVSDEIHKILKSLDTDVVAGSFSSNPEFVFYFSSQPASRHGFDATPVINPQIEKVIDIPSQIRVRTNAVDGVFATADFSTVVRRLK